MAIHIPRKIKDVLPRPKSFLNKGLYRWGKIKPTKIEAKDTKSNRIRTPANNIPIAWSIYPHKEEIKQPVTSNV